MVEIGAGVAVHVTGSGTDVGGPAWISLLRNVVWVVGITNAFNLLHMDGLSASVAAPASAAFCLIAGLNGQYLVAAGIAGCATGCLRHNFHPAKIYMGDVGSLFPGFLLVALALKLTLTGPASS